MTSSVFLVSSVTLWSQSSTVSFSQQNWEQSGFLAPICYHWYIMGHSEKLSTVRSLQLSLLQSSTMEMSSSTMVKERKSLFAVYAHERQLISKMLQMTDNHVQIWFQNKRYRTKRELCEQQHQRFRRNIFHGTCETT